MGFEYSFSFDDDAGVTISGQLLLDLPSSREGVAFRHGRICLDNGKRIEVILCHSPATSSFIYLSEKELSQQYLKLLKIEPNETLLGRSVNLPGQLILGAERTTLIQEGIGDQLSSPALQSLFMNRSQENIVTLPVLREGVKYGLSEKIFQKYGYYCNEVVSDAHHIEDDTGSIYKRRVTQTIFKDADLTEQGRKDIDTVFIGDSIASGTVILGVLNKIGKRLKGVENVEVIAPLATLRGLARIANYSSPGVEIRVHVFETLLNALPPDFYYSAHFPEAGFHIDPEAQRAYLEWWGRDGAGNAISDTACAGYGWSEAFFAPEMQIEMINSQLKERHSMSLSEILARTFR